MTANELSRMQYMRRSIKQDVERLNELKAKAYAPSSPNLSGVRLSSGFDSRLENFALKIDEAERCIANKQVQYMQEWIRLERYIATIPDSLTRLILTLRFVEGESWRRIAAELGRCNTAESVRERAYRHLKRMSLDA